MPSINIPNNEISKAYADGGNARRLNKPKIIPFPINTDKDFCLKYWFLAGWNDAHIELNNGDKK